MYVSIDTIPSTSFIFSETFAETLPQLFVLVCLITSSIIDDGNNTASPIMSFYILKLLISALSSSFGMAKFLQLGPCQLIPQNKMGIGMLMITITNFCGLLWKFIFITAALYLYVSFKNPSIGPTQMFLELFWRSSCVQLLPGIILVNSKHTIIYSGLW